MRITKLSLTNFRSFRETQTIEFAPVTLLFGPNSVGKSTVILALFYIQEILQNGNCDPQRIDALGGKIIGGFKNLVNGKDLNKSINLKVEYVALEKIGSNYSEFTEFFDQSEANDLASMGLDFLQGAADAETVAIELEIAWSQEHKQAYVKTYSVWLEGELIATLVSDAGLKQPLIADLNYQHEYMRAQSHDDWFAEQVDSQNYIHTSQMHKVCDYLGVDFPSDEELEYRESGGHAYSGEDPLGLITFSQTEFVSQTHALISAGRIPSDKFQSPEYHSGFTRGEGFILHAPFSYKGFTGALPVLGKKMNLSLDFDDVMVTEIIRELFSNILVVPLDDLLVLLESSLCIGPLRHIPDLKYQTKGVVHQADWYSGKACWDALQTVLFSTVCDVNRWLGDVDKLNIGYQLVYKFDGINTLYIKPSTTIETFEDVILLNKVANFDFTHPTAAEKSEENIKDERELPEIPIDVESIQNHLEAAKKSQYLVSDDYSEQISPSLWDIHNGIEVSASDIGVGVSQILPLVVASQMVKKGIISIEQPELHVHPRVQVAIGDLLTQSDTNANFLIETHSEHLILRLLRRVRETSDNELPDGLEKVRPEDISIVYLEPSKKGVIAKSIDIDKDGEFTSKWPSGFFSERREEMF